MGSRSNRLRNRIGFGPTLIHGIGANTQAKRQDLTNSIGLLIIRVMAGALIITHGWGKLQMLFTGRHSEFADPIGLGTFLSLTLATFAEFFCAILVIVGFATRFATAPLAFTMIVAAFIVHANDPMARKELGLLYLAVFLSLIFTGAGKLSIDGLIWPWWRARRARLKSSSS